MTTAGRRDGGIRVRTDEAGRPLEIHIEDGQLRRSAGAVGTDILELCRIAGARAGVARRATLASQGVPPDVLAELGLPTRDALVTLEERFDDRDAEVDSWLRPL